MCALFELCSDGWLTQQGAQHSSRSHTAKPMGLVTMLYRDSMLAHLCDWGPPVQDHHSRRTLVVEHFPQQDLEATPVRNYCMQKVEICKQDSVRDGNTLSLFYPGTRITTSPHLPSVVTSHPFWPSFMVNCTTG